MGPHAGDLSFNIFGIIKGRDDLLLTHMKDQTGLVLMMIRTGSIVICPYLSLIYCSHGPRPRRRCYVSFQINKHDFDGALITCRDTTAEQSHLLERSLWVDVDDTGRVKDGVLGEG